MFVFVFAVISKPTDCIFPYDFNETVKKKVSGDALLYTFAQKHRKIWLCLSSVVLVGAPSIFQSIIYILII